jgi:hypothetical protein
MNTRPLLVIVGAALLSGCAYGYQPNGYEATGYPSSSPYYSGYQRSYQPGYQPGYQQTYQQPYQPYPYRSAPYGYRYYSQPQANGSSGG